MITSNQILVMHNLQPHYFQAKARHFHFTCSWLWRSIRTLLHPNQQLPFTSAFPPPRHKRHPFTKHTSDCQNKVQIPANSFVLFNYPFCSKIAEIPATTSTFRHRWHIFLPRIPQPLPLAFHVSQEIAYGAIWSDIKGITDSARAKRVSRALNELWIQSPTCREKKTNTAGCAHRRVGKSSQKYEKCPTDLSRRRRKAKSGAKHPGKIVNGKKVWHCTRVAWKAPGKTRL